MERDCVQSPRSAGGRMTKEEFIFLFGEDVYSETEKEARAIQKLAYPEWAAQGSKKEEYLKYTEVSVTLILAVLINKLFKEMK